MCVVRQDASGYHTLRSQELVTICALENPESSNFIYSSNYLKKVEVLSDLNVLGRNIFLRSFDKS